AYYPEPWNIWQNQNGRWVELLATPLTLQEVLDPYGKLLRGLEQLSGWSQVKMYPGKYWYRGWYGWGPIFNQPPSLPEQLGKWDFSIFEPKWREVRCGV